MSTFPIIRYSVLYMLTQNPVRALLLSLAGLLLLPLGFWLMFQPTGATEFFVTVGLLIAVMLLIVSIVTHLVHRRANVYRVSLLVIVLFFNAIIFAYNYFVLSDSLILVAAFFGTLLCLLLGFLVVTFALSFKQLFIK